MLAICARPTTPPISAVVIATAPTAATYGTKRRITSRLSTAELRTGERSLGHARHREARGDAREVDLCRVRRLKDLVAELELDRAPQRRELASRRAGAHEIVERVEQRLLVQRGERVPIAQRVDDVARQPQALRSPLGARTQTRGDGVLDEQLGRA